MIEHEPMYLELGLCSCNKVPNSHNVDGYKAFYSVSEWWSWSTPFPQWFSKNFCSVALPFSSELGLSEGHVPLEDHFNKFSVHSDDI